MIKTGISTACFYPALTEESLGYVIESGAKVSEIFVNAQQEFCPAFFDSLRRRAEGAGVEIVSVHPYSSGMETQLFFSEYPRRLEDGMEMYRQVFSLSAGIGAQYVVFHGAYTHCRLPQQEIYERYWKLHTLAEREGVTLLHENVSRCKSKDPQFIQGMRDYLGDGVRFVLDTKQAVRAGYTAAALREAMGPALRHVHISDYAPGQDCLPPGRGIFDIGGFLRELESSGFSGAALVEVYRDNYRTREELYDSYKLLASLAPNEG